MRIRNKKAFFYLSIGAIDTMLDENKHPSEMRVDYLNLGFKGPYVMDQFLLT